MSSDEEAVAIGRIVTEHQEARRRYMALRSEQERIAKVLELIGSLLKYGHPLHQITQDDWALLDVDRIRTHSAETTAAFARLQELQEKLSALGLSPKSER